MSWTSARTSSAAKPVLYFAPGSRASRSYWMFLELGVDVDIKMVNLLMGEHKKPEYTDINPAGEVPTLITGGQTLTDSSAIILHALDKYDTTFKWGGKPGTPQRDFLYRMAFYCCSRADDPAIQVLLHTMIYPEKMRNPDVAAEKAKYFKETCIPVFLKALGSNQYFGGSEFLAVDVVVGYVLNVAKNAGLLNDAPAAPLLAYVGRVTARPLFTKAHSAPQRKLTMYHAPGSRSTRALWLAYELGLEIDIKYLDLLKGDQKKPEYLQMNPLGEVPTLIDGSLTLTDSSAIILHLLDSFDKDGKLGGKPGTAMRSNFYRWSHICASRVDDAVIQTFLHTLVLPQQMRNAALVAEKTKFFKDVCVNVLVQGLGKKKFFNGDEFSAIDVVIGYILNIAQMAGLLKDPECAPLADYVGRLTTRPLFAKANARPEAAAPSKPATRYLITSFSNTGAATLKHLLALGETDITVGARNVKDASAKILAAGAKHVVELDMEKAETVNKALQGIDRAILTLGFPATDFNKVLVYAENFVAAAKANKLKLIARISAVGSDPNGQGFAAFQGKADQMIKAAGIPWVILEPNFFYSNTLNNLQGIRTGQVHGAAGTGKSAWISPDDIGALSAALLANPDKHGVNKTYPVANCSIWSDAEVYAAIGRTIGKTIQYIDHSPEEYVKLLVSFGVPKAAAEAFAFFENIRRQGWAGQTDTQFEKIVGRKQQTPDEWAKANAAAFK